ncbi:MAG: TRAM domain-containing protein, partial [Chloroflexi bacterium]|nr:TRAM domain-containing protein [Chloroflexota bacterium]
AASTERRNRRLLARSVEVLVEREEDGRASGRTRGGQIVHFQGAGLVGRLVDVTIDQVSAWSLQGRRAGDLTLAVV